MLYSDYGHIASSIEFGYAMLRQKYPDKSLIAVFQPHQMHRVLTGWEAFPQAMENWDEKYIYPIYAARENISDFVEEGLFLEHKIESVEQLGKIFAEHCHAEYLADFEELKSKLESV